MTIFKLSLTKYPEVMYMYCTFTVHVVDQAHSTNLLLLLVSNVACGHHNTIVGLRFWEMVKYAHLYSQINVHYI